MFHAMTADQARERAGDGGADENNKRKKSHEELSNFYLFFHLDVMLFYALLLDKL